MATINNINSLYGSLAYSPITSKYGVRNIVSDYNKNNVSQKISNINYTNPGTVYFPSGIAADPSLGTSSFSSSSIQNVGVYIMFNFYQYVRPKVNIVPQTVAQGSIVLPIPNDLKDSQFINYGVDNVPTAIELGIGEISSGGKNAAQYSTDEINSLTGGLVGAGTSVLSNVLSKIPIINQLNTPKGIPPGLGLQLGGYATNPYLTVLFKSPTFKRFMFSWLFIPQSKSESDTLDFILNKFKYHSLPDFAAPSSISVNGPIYTYPDMCKPQLIPNQYQFNFKYCVIESISVDYVPGGTPAFHATSNAPVAIRLTVSLLEIELWSKEDFKNGING